MSILKELFLGLIAHGAEKYFGYEPIIRIEPVTYRNGEAFIPSKVIGYVHYRGGVVFLAGPTPVEDVLESSLFYIESRSNQKPYQVLYCYANPFNASVPPLGINDQRFTAFDLEYNSSPLEVAFIKFLEDFPKIGLKEDSHEVISQFSVRLELKEPYRVNYDNPKSIIRPEYIYFSAETNSAGPVEVDLVCAGISTKTHSLIVYGDISLRQWLGAQFEYRAIQMVSSHLYKALPPIKVFEDTGSMDYYSGFLSTDDKNNPSFESVLRDDVGPKIIDRKHTYYFKKGAFYHISGNIPDASEVGHPVIIMTMPSKCAGPESVKFYCIKE